MSIDRTQFERYEIKYCITEEKAAAVRGDLGRHLVPDEFAAALPGRRYAVHSLYLDADNLDLYQQTVDGESNRFKLRVRYYDEAMSSPIFFEIKQRVHEHIFKYRAQVRRSAVGPLIAGHRPMMQHLASPDLRHLANLQQFSRLMQRLGATPRVHVAYLREAWVSPLDNSVRVTMDRCVKCGPEFGSTTRAALAYPKEVFCGEVILELKFRSRMPGWLAEMCRSFELVRCSAAKYARGVDALGRDRISMGASRRPLVEEALLSSRASDGDAERHAATLKLALPATVPRGHLDTDGMARLW